MKASVKWQLWTDGWGKSGNPAWLCSTIRLQKRRSVTSIMPKYLWRGSGWAKLGVFGLIQHRDGKDVS